MTKIVDPIGPKTLRNWEARRAGGRITVYGQNLYTGVDDKITNVDKITPPSSAADHHAVAVDKHGVEHKLVFITQ